MDTLCELEKVLEKKIEEVLKKNDVSPTELERLDKAVDIIKDIETIWAMKDYSYEESENEDYGYSGRYPYYMRENKHASYNYDMPHDNYSYRRGRDRMTGRYVSRSSRPMSYRDPGYSMAYDKEDLRMELHDMMNSSKSDKERMAIQNLLDQWKE